MRLLTKLIQVLIVPVKGIFVSCIRRLGSIIHNLANLSSINSVDMYKIPAAIIWLFILISHARSRSYLALNIHSFKHYLVIFLLVLLTHVFDLVTLAGIIRQRFEVRGLRRFSSLLIV